MARTIAVVNQKGGTAKTTTVANLGAALALKGQRVLVCDLDSQASLSAHLGFDETSRALTLVDVLLDGAPVDEVITNGGIEGLHLAPSTVGLTRVEKALSGEPGSEQVLRLALRDVSERYDYVLFDCPPSLGTMTMNALIAATEVLIPLQTEWFALRGLKQICQTVELVRQRLNERLRLWAIVLCLHRARERLAEEVVATLQDRFGDLVLNTKIRRNVRLAEAPGHGLPIQVYAPSCPGAEDYNALGEEVLARESALTPGA